MLISKGPETKERPSGVLSLLFGIFAGFGELIEWIVVSNSSTHTEHHFAQDDLTDEEYAHICDEDFLDLF